jgi:hypothetical protein
MNSIRYRLSLSIALESSVFEPSFMFIDIRKLAGSLARGLCMLASCSGMGATVTAKQDKPGPVEEDEMD